jgi:uncharacterized protein (DUF4415 family)
VKIEFNPAKNARNIAERGISFERAEDFEWVTVFGSSASGRRIEGRRGSMRKRPNLEKIDDENPEWTAEDFRRARPAFDVLPPELVETIKKRRQGQRGPQRAPVKAKVTLRLDRGVLEHFKATGRGWQTRINEVLKHQISDRKAS